MDRHVTGQRESLLALYESAQGEQVRDLVRQVREAQGDVEKLATLKVEPVPAALLLDHLGASAEAGEAAAKRERNHQLGGAKAKATLLAVERTHVDAVLEQLAVAAVLNLGERLSSAASARASAVAPLPPEEAAAKVAEHLSGLSDAGMKQQLNGAIQRSYGTGRQAFMDVNVPTSIVASELLDNNTCEPCADVDGTEYETIAESEDDYPYGGGYIDCEGGLNCRGTIIAIYGRAPSKDTTTPTPPEPIPTPDHGPVAEVAEAVAGSVAADLTPAAIDAYEAAAEKSVAKNIVPRLPDHPLLENFKANPAQSAEGARGAQAAIDQVMRWPEPNGDLAFKPKITGSYVAAYDPTPRGLYANMTHLMIDGNPEAGWRTTFTHELGHRLDALFAPRTGEIGRRGTLATNVIDAGVPVENQAEFDALLRELAPKIDELSSKTAKEYIPKAKSYWASKPEVFARAFAQYIATKTGDKEALKALHATMKQAGPITVQWADDEFTPIAEAFDDLFSAKGLLK